MNMDEFTGRRIAIKGGVSGIGKVVAFHLLDTAAGRGQINVNFPKKVLAGDVTANFPLRLGLKNLSLAGSCQEWRCADGACRDVARIPFSGELLGTLAGGLHRHVIAARGYCPVRR